MKKIAMYCTQEQWEAIKPKLEKNPKVQIKSISSTWYGFPYLTNCLSNMLGVVSNVGYGDRHTYGRAVYQKWDEAKFLEACDCEVEPDTEPKYCFTQKQVDEMFNNIKSNCLNLNTLEKIFGKQKQPIDWDRIKTGSRVMIKHTDEICNFIKHSVNLDKPVDVIFFKTPHYITNNGCFYSAGRNPLYCTFHQDGNYILYAAHENTDYITQVIEY